MKNIIDIMDEVTKFIVGGEDETLLDKKKKTIGFVADGVKPKRKYTKRKKKNAKEPLPESRPEPRPCAARL